MKFIPRIIFLGVFLIFFAQSSISICADNNLRKFRKYYPTQKTILDSLNSILMFDDYFEKTTDNISLSTTQFIKSHSSMVGNSLIGLLFLFEDMNDVKSLETLASLSSYNFGVAPNEIYLCLIIRKGTKIEKELKKARNRNYCKERIGKKNQFCASDEEIRDNVDNYIELINKHEKCEYPL